MTYPRNLGFAIAVLLGLFKFIGHDGGHGATQEQNAPQRLNELPPGLRRS
jgi:hypothetical protein